MYIIIFAGSIAKKQRVLEERSRIAEGLESLEEVSVDKNSSDSVLMHCFKEEAVAMFDAQLQLAYAKAVDAGILFSVDNIRVTYKLDTDAVNSMGETMGDTGSNDGSSEEEEGSEEKEGREIWKEKKEADDKKKRKKDKSVRLMLSLFGKDFFKFEGFLKAFRRQAIASDWELSGTVRPSMIYVLFSLHHIDVLFLF